MRRFCIIGRSSSLQCDVIKDELRKYRSLRSVGRGNTIDSIYQSLSTKRPSYRPYVYGDDVIMSPLKVHKCLISNPRINHTLIATRSLSSISKYDLLAGSLSHQGTSHRRPKVVLDAYSSTGFDVLNLLYFPSQQNDGATTNTSLMSRKDLNIKNDENEATSNSVHMKGSIIVFPYSCFLWNISRPDQVTLESLAIVALHKPPIQYLFIGADNPMPKTNLTTIQKYFKQNFNIIVEQMDLTNAMGTFNILNGEDRRVAAALLLDEGEESIYHDKERSMFV